MTPLQVKYAIDSIFTSGFTVGGSGIILPGNPTNPLGAVPKQYVDDSISAIEFPVTVTELYNQNKNYNINFSSNTYSEDLFTFDDWSYFENDILLIKFRVNSFSCTTTSSIGSLINCNYQLHDINIASISLISASIGQHNGVTNAKWSEMFYTSVYDALDQEHTNRGPFFRSDNYGNYAINSKLTFSSNRSSNVISNFKMNIDIKILLVKFI